MQRENSLYKSMLEYVRVMIVHQHIVGVLVLVVQEFPAMSGRPKQEINLLVRSQKGS